MTRLPAEFRTGDPIEMIGSRSHFEHPALAALPILTLLLAVCVARAGEYAPVSAEADASRPFVVKIHADWCGACAHTEDTVAQLHDTAGDIARIVILDVTSREAIVRSRAEATRLGLTAFFDANRSQTGTIGILHGETRKVLSVFKGEGDLAVYQEALASAALVDDEPS